MSEHTATPWTIHRFTLNKRAKTQALCIFGDDERSLPVIGAHGGIANIENAKFIVRAVNAHDALVEVLATAESLNNMHHAGISEEEMALAWSDLYQQTAKARAALNT